MALTDGLVGRWHPTTDNTGNGTTTLYDQAGSNNGTLTNMDAATDWVADTASGGVRALDMVTASSQYVSFAAPITGRPLTISCWFKVTNLTAEHALVTLADNSAATSYFALYAAGADAGDPVKFDSRSGGITSARTTTAYSANTWHHALATIDAGGVQTVYIDGGSSATASARTPTGIDTGAAGVLIRSSLYGHMDGRVDCVLIYDRVLTSAEITLLAASRNPFATGPDLSVNGKEPVAAWVPSLDTAGNGTTSLIDLVGDNHGTLTNMDAATDWVADTDAGGVRALDFDGVNDRVLIANSSTFDSLPNLSISCWIKTTYDSGSHAIISKRASYSYSGIPFEQMIASNVSQLRVANDFTTNGSGAISFNQWVFITGTWDGITVNNYIDGLFTFAFTRTKSYSQNTQPIAIGSHPNGSESYVGLLDDIRIFNTVLTADDIAYLYNSGTGRGRVVEPAPTGVTYHPLSSRSTHPLRFSI